MPQDELSPLMKQYWDLKAQAGDALLFFRMGDFYELFGDDAIEAARILEITLTSRDKNKPNPTPMAGVPHHSYIGYLTRLLKAGKKVGIAEQVEDPEVSRANGKSIVRRELIRIFTPAVQFENEGAESSFLATTVACENKSSANTRWVLACLDPSTGETLVSDPLSEAALATELMGLPIRHYLSVDRLGAPEAQATMSQGSVLVEELPFNTLAAEQADALLKRHYGVETLDAFFNTPAAVQAVGLLVHYSLKAQQQERLAHLKLPAPLHRPQTLVLGPRTAQHLDLIPSQDGPPNLYDFINKTRSSLGARQLKRWLLEPLKSPIEISARQAAVRELADAPRMIERLSSELAQLYDLERICGRINARLANPRDTLALGKSLATLPVLTYILESPRSETLGGLKQTLIEAHSKLEPLFQKIIRTQKDDAPLSVRDGGIFGMGTHPDLDRLISLTEDGQRWLVELESRERETTGIPSLKVRYNRVFGYYIEVTQAHLKNVPSHYQRKQTTVGAERFFTEELKKFEEEIVTASSRQKALEQQLFEELTREILDQTPQIMKVAQALGELDSLASLAKLAEEPGWSFPVVDDSFDIDIQAGRHPLVDQASRGAFVPNDLLLSPESRMTLLITGPNMGGKSTVMRQSALIIVLGQLGAPVPAAQARWGAVSALYTRIGAHDAIARGQSTFMVEMSELAHILHHADERSLIVLDEIGRGTSTYDGISVAWSTLEWICTQIRARTLFATHYHELTRLAGSLPLLANAHMAVEGARSMKRGSLRFLYKLQEGPANESFGVHVARIAGLPSPVVERAWKVLEELEAVAQAKGEVQSTTDQLSLFSYAQEGPKADSVPQVPLPAEEEHPLLKEIEGADVNQMTPVQALNFLVKLQESARRPSSNFA